MIYDILIQPDDWAQAGENLSSEHVQRFALFVVNTGFIIVTMSHRTVTRSSFLCTRVQKERVWNQ